ncbi:hypothetical protein D9613_003001 [Agrocybe pediades]|uniref:Sfi1 spindle body domain-containing protein n=1 Tax=Agrocybe pediades TaxID=84607 RepID=A0A8H4QPT2_9AGAR|nr:hypothetical protein D9613_003001 [Agrocybe pediades]
MSYFQPTRASPPIRNSAPSTSSLTEITSSAAAPELQHLTNEDIEILETVIRRAGPTATTFFTIFKAYSDVIKELGLDPQEVVYYGKLLKLGNLKGKTWREKWEVAKSMSEPPPVTPTVGGFQSISDFQPPSQIEEEHVFANRQNKKGRVSLTSKTSSILERIAKSKAANPARKAENPPMREIPTKSPAAVTAKASMYATSTIVSDDGGATSYQIPPSYKSTNPAVAPGRVVPSLQIAPRPEFGNQLTNLPLPVSKPKRPSTEHKRPVDLDDAFKNIKLEQDEKFADKYREDVILARSWEIWRQGFMWIQTTHQQIGEARDKLTLKLLMQRWQNRIASKKQAEDEKVKRHQSRIVVQSFRIWQARLKQKRQAAWRNDMRQKMKIVKTKSEMRIKTDAWFHWKRLAELSRADRYYQRNLLLRYQTRWKNKLTRLDDMDNMADHFSEETHIRTLHKFWYMWKQGMSLQHDERVITQRVDHRIMVATFQAWRARFGEMEVAETVRQRNILRTGLAKWKGALNNIKASAGGKYQALDHKATRHASRQDELLLRAVLRIWRARTRGRRYEQFSAITVQKNAWKKWRTRMVKEESRIDEAALFFENTNARLIATTLTRWRKVQESHKNAQEYAIKQYDSRLLVKMLALWRVRLQETSQAAKVARWANRFFATRRAWNTWVAAMEERRRQERLRLWNASKAQKIFQSWRQRTQRQQYLKQCEQIIQEHIQKRLVTDALVKWTNRVIEVKSRELDVAHQRDVALQRHHAEDLSLLESYMLVRREELMRQAFQRWLTAKRAAEHRRINHQRKEAHVRQVIITTAWEKWRERFKEERLRPLEYQVILENQKRMMAHAFNIWFSKTRTLPAVHFHSNRIKAKFFKQWKDALPNALRAKKARDVDRLNTLATFFERWTQAYKTKLTLKAVARAKYLRLPAASSSRPAVTRSRPLYSGTGNAFPRRAIRDSEDEESQTGEETLKDAFAARSRGARSPKPRSERSNPRSEYGPSIARQPSPVRSIVSMPDRRSRSPSRANVPSSPARSRNDGGGRLWTALKDFAPPPRRSRHM